MKREIQTYEQITDYYINAFKKNHYTNMGGD